MASRNKDCCLLDTIPATSLLSLGSNKQTANKKHTMAKKKSPVGCFIMLLHFLEFTFFLQLEPKWTHQLKFYQLVCLCYTECFSLCTFFFFLQVLTWIPPEKTPQKPLRWNQKQFLQELCGKYPPLLTQVFDLECLCKVIYIDFLLFMHVQVRSGNSVMHYLSIYSVKNK